MNVIVYQNAKKPVAKLQKSINNKQKIYPIKSKNQLVNHFLFLQRTIGNQTVQGLIKSGTLQAKLESRQPGNKYDQETEGIADTVMKMPEQKAIPIARGMSEYSEDISPDLESNIQTIRSGSYLPSDKVRTFMEPRFGVDFSQVRIHADTQAAGFAKAMNAKAYTVGKDIVFAEGQYNPESLTGKRLLAHELTHVLQQNSGKNGISIQMQSEGAKVEAKLKELAKKMKKAKTKALAEWDLGAAKLLLDIAAELEDLAGQSVSDSVRKYVRSIKGDATTIIGITKKDSVRLAAMKVHAAASKL